jgi:type VI secretion system secreted protein Hcp
MRTRTLTPLIVGVAAGAADAVPEGRRRSIMSAEMAYLDLQLQAAGKVKGDSTTTSLGRKDLIEVWAFDHAVTGPRDQSTGQATGRRVEKPVRWITPVGTASVVLFQGLVGNDTLVKAVFHFFNHDRTGKEIEQFRITLEDGSISSISTRLPNVKASEVGFHDEYHEIEFTYRKITVENLEARNSATDDSGKH